MSRHAPARPRTTRRVAALATATAALVLLTPGDAAALADALDTLKRDGALRERLVASGRATAVRRFGTETYVERVEKILADTAKAAKAKKR